MVHLQYRNISFPTDIEAPRELAHIGLVSKHHYQPQMIQFDVLNDPSWQADIEDKQGRFQLDHNQPFAFQNRNMVHNPRDHEWIPNATDSPWAKCVGKNPEHEYLVIHTLAWSLQLNNITLSFDVKSELIYYGKTRIKCDLEHGYCPPNHAFNATVIREPNNHCRIFDVSSAHD